MAYGHPYMFDRFQYLSDIKKMKFFTAVLPFALSNRIPDFLPTQNDDSGVLKLGHSLCESDECPNLDGASSYGKDLTVDDISTTSCSSSYKESFLSARMERCEYYDASHSDCSEWATKELNSACGGYHNCIETKWSNISGWGQYWGYSSR